jgi:hypothetical protein
VALAWSLGSNLSSDELARVSDFRSRLSLSPFGYLAQEFNEAFKAGFLHFATSQTGQRWRYSHIRARLLELLHVFLLFCELIQRERYSRMNSGRHRCNVLPDVKELCGPRSFCSSGGAAVYLYTGQLAHPPTVPHLFLDGVARDPAHNPLGLFW